MERGRNISPQRPQLRRFPSGPKPVGHLRVGVVLSNAINPSLRRLFSYYHSSPTTNFLSETLLQVSGDSAAERGERAGDRRQRAGGEVAVDGEPVSEQGGAEQGPEKDEQRWILHEAVAAEGEQELPDGEEEAAQVLQLRCSRAGEEAEPRVLLVAAAARGARLGGVFRG